MSLSADPSAKPIGNSAAVSSKRSTIRMTAVLSDGSATFDFTGTGPEVYGSTNGPTSVTYSAIIYVLRCLVREDIPQNQGYVNPDYRHYPAAYDFLPQRYGGRRRGYLRNLPAG